MPRSSVTRRLATASFLDIPGASCPRVVRPERERFGGREQGTSRARTHVIAAVVPLPAAAPPS